MNTPGEKIAQFRKQRGLTQAKLAEKASISTSSVAMYETNRRQPDDATIVALATALEVPVQTLFGADIEAKSPVTADAELGSTEVGSVVDASSKPSVENGWTNLALSRDEARLILFIRMHPDCLEFLQNFMNANADVRKQIEKTWRLIQAFQA